MHSVLYDSETVRGFQGQVDIAFHGYDSDPREIYEVPEIRSFIRALDTKFPYWFYFLSTESHTLKMLTFCLCRFTKLGPGLAMPQQADLHQFLLTHFDALNQLCDEHQIPETINREISQCIEEYYFNTQTVKPP